MRIIDSITLFITATIEHVLFRLFFTWGYDADGNQTTIKTKTGIWQVTYNGENRPIRWEQIADAEGHRIVFNATIVTMTYDCMGRRVTKTTTQPDTPVTRLETFVYDGYLQVANQSTISNQTTQQFYIWGPTEPIATRPLVWNRDSKETAFYLHDGNKNVSEVVSASGEILAHYTYAPFGDCTAFGSSALSNPWRFSSEYAEGELACVYYNYREYNPMMGRWFCRDIIENMGDFDLNLISTENEFIFDDRYLFLHNRLFGWFDILGLYPISYYNKYENPTFAVRRRGRYINPKSRIENREYCGCVCKLYKNERLRYFTTQTVGTIDSCMPSMVPCPIGSTWVAIWHTHGGPDPRYDNENFSTEDRLYSDNLGIDIYLITPDNCFKQYIPGQGDINRGSL